MDLLHKFGFWILHKFGLLDTLQFKSRRVQLQWLNVSSPVPCAANTKPHIKDTDLKAALAHIMRKTATMHLLGNPAGWLQGSATLAFVNGYYLAWDGVKYHNIAESALTYLAGSGRRLPATSVLLSALIALNESHLFLVVSADCFF